MEMEADFKVRTSEELLAAALSLDIDVATELLAEAGGNAWFIAQRSDIASKYGLEPQKIMRLAAAMALAEKSRMATDEGLDMSSGEKIAANFAEMNALGHEQLWVVYLTWEGHMIRREMMSKGNMTSTMSVGRLIVRNALMCNAHQIVVVHNHPQANRIEPSDGDVWSTRDLKQQLSLFNIGYLDDVIVGGGKYYSFREGGELSDDEGTDLSGPMVSFMGGTYSPRKPKMPEGMEPIPEVLP